MPREGRPWWWPRCSVCGQWLSWARMAKHELDEPWRCARCVRRYYPRPEETAHV